MHHQGHETTEVGGDHFRSTGVKPWATVEPPSLLCCLICMFVHLSLPICNMIIIWAIQFWIWEAYNLSFHLLSIMAHRTILILLYAICFNVYPRIFIHLFVIFVLFSCATLHVWINAIYILSSKGPDFGFANAWFWIWEVWFGVWESWFEVWKA